MFRFISAWLQVVLRYMAAWLQAAAAAAAAAADKLDAASLSLQGTVAMDFPVTVSLGPIHRHLHSFRATENILPDGVSDGEIRRLEEALETLFTELKIASEADDPSFTARCWMKEVRELRYDAEDFFNEVPRSPAGAGRSALQTAILWIPSKLKRRRQVAQAFSDLRARAKDASRRRQSFQLGPATVKPGSGQAQADVSLSKSLQLIGLEESMDRLVKLLALDDQDIAELLAFDGEDTEQQVQVVPIFGVAGVGKTTLARTFYHKFGGKFQCRAFVRVSRNPDMRRMLSSMLSQIKAPPVHGFPDVQDLIEHVREYLQFNRYLIVIDDLWASSTWDIISRAFPDGDCCSRIMVTTEIKDVALACSRYLFKYMYEMSPLNGDQSRQLFLSRVFGSENGCPPDFKEVTYEIIQECGGLPLAIENIASMFACELDADQWKHMRDSIPPVLSLTTCPSSEGLKEILNIIYNNLSPYLKTCLLYLIMYPEGNTISKEDLVKQWLAEDFIGEGQNREKTARGYFDELVSRGMIQPIDRNSNDEVLTCTVHHMVLDLIRYKSLEENFIINVSCFQTTPCLPDKVRRLSVQFGGAKCANIPADFMMNQVRSLIFFGFLNCVPSVVEYKLLRVLILHIWADESKIFDLTRIGELFQLRCLKIDCNITVHLPDEIRQLKFLETLELHAPVNDMPSDISCLPLLRTLGYFDLSKNSLENVWSLGELNNLQDLHLTWSNIAEPDNLKNNMQCLRSILWKLSNLKSLTLVPAASSDAGVLDNAAGASVGISGDILSSMSSPPALLQRLELSGRCCIFSSLPEWTKELGNLCILKISVRKLLRKDIDILKGLPALMALSLYIWTAPVGKVVFDNEGFSVLKYFKFTCAAPCAAFLKGAMPSVRELKLAFNANRMEQYPQIVPGLEYLIELREIAAEVGGTGADESDRRYAESALSGAIANHPCTPIIRVECVDQILFGAVTQEQEYWTLEEQHEIQEELLDPLPEFLISTPSTQTQMRYGEQDEGRDRSVEVLTQEQEHWTLDPVPELLSTPSTPTQTRDGVQGEQMERSKEQEQEHRITEKQHEVQVELLDPLADLPISEKQHEVSSRSSSHHLQKGGHLQVAPLATMEAALVSAATGALKPVLAKLGALANDEYKRFKGVRDDIKSLTRELTAVEAFLLKMSEEEDPDIQDKVWMNEVRELSYDMEDYIDDFMQTVGSEDSKPDGFLEKIKNSLGKMKARRRIGNEIGDLKKQIIKVAERNARYKSREAFSKAKNATVDPRALAIFQHASELVGIDEPKAEVIKLLTQGASTQEKMNMVSIVGSGGMGKTTLANQVYQDLKGKFNCRAFLTMSRNPDMMNIMRTIFSEVSGKDYANTEAGSIQQLIIKIADFLADKRYFVVLDDIWDVDTWNVIKLAFPVTSSGSIIITTTRINDVAESCCSRPYNGDIYCIRPLQMAHSRKLFYTRLFNTEENCPSYLKKVSEHILKKCAGLPLAIIAISGLLANIERTEGPWKQVEDSIGRAVERNPSVEGMMKILSLSYFDLPAHLKSCLLCLSIFPEDSVIKKKVLINRWIAERLIHTEAGYSTTYEFGERCFNELINRSLIQPVEDRYGRVKSCRLHDTILDFIISKSTEENFVTLVGVPGLTVGRQSKVRRLSLQAGQQKELIVPKGLVLSHVRSLDVFGTSAKLPSMDKFRHLRFLDFEDCDQLENHHLENIGRLFQLRYLSLLRVGKVSKLPEQIGHLWCLEILDIRGTSVCELPASIVNLKRLVHLLVPNVTLPCGISKLQALEKLRMVSVYSQSFNLLQELEQLQGLKKLTLDFEDYSSAGRGNAAENESKKAIIVATVKSLGNLLSLTVWDDPELVGKSLCPMPLSLRKLAVWRSSIPHVPKWVGSLLNLQVLRLELVRAEQKDFYILGGLPVLRHLILKIDDSEIRNTSLTEEPEATRVIVRGEVGFPCLRIFVYDSHSAVMNLTFAAGAMPKVDDLFIEFNTDITKSLGTGGAFDLGIENLPSLVKITCIVSPSKNHMYSSRVKAAIREAANAHPNRPSLSFSWSGLPESSLGNNSN